MIIFWHRCATSCHGSVVFPWPGNRPISLFIYIYSDSQTIKLRQTRILRAENQQLWSTGSLCCRGKPLTRFIQNGIEGPRENTCVWKNNNPRKVSARSFNRRVSSSRVADWSQFLPKEASSFARVVVHASNIGTHVTLLPSYSSNVTARGPKEEHFAAHSFESTTA